jgi:hypothetical protein
MGWFSKSDNTQASTQFGSPTGMTGMGMGMGMGAGMGMDPMMMMQQTQNPMMQQMANDPITATARLLQLNDPVAQFITTQNIGLLMELVGEVVRLSIKEFFSNVEFIQNGDKIVLDASSLPAAINTLSPENLGLTMTKLQSSAQQTLAMNEQQRQMFLQAHSMGIAMNPQQQPGFFGSLIGGMLGNQVQQQGGLGNVAKTGATMAGGAIL